MQEDAHTKQSAWGADASHRGGEPGFLREENGRLVFDDFPGNNMFNTLGNIQHYARCGILLIDFDTGELVQLSADARIEHTENARRIVLDIAETRHFTLNIE